MNTEDRVACLARIGEILREQTNETRLIEVFAGVPPSLPPLQAPMACYWLAGESSKEETLGNVMVTTQIRVMLLWPLSRAATREAREVLEADVWNAMRDIQEALRADSDLGGTCTDSKIGLVTSQEPVIELNAGDRFVTYRYLEFDIEVWDLEAEAISA